MRDKMGFVLRGEIRRHLILRQGWWGVMFTSSVLNLFLSIYLSAVYWIINGMTFNQHISASPRYVLLCVCVCALSVCIQYIVNLIDGWMMTEVSRKDCCAFFYLSAWKMMHASDSSLLNPHTDLYLHMMCIPTKEHEHCFSAVASCILCVFAQ